MGHFSRDMRWNTEKQVIMSSFTLRIKSTKTKKKGNNNFPLLRAWLFNLHVSYSPYYDTTHSHFTSTFVIFPMLKWQTGLRMYVLVIWKLSCGGYRCHIPQCTTEFL